MKKSIINTVITFLFVTTCYSQVLWEEINTPVDTEISAIEVNSYGDIFIGKTASSGGGVYYSFDQGNNWEYLGFETKTIYSLEINELDNIYVGTNKGTSNYSIYRSIDNGQNWEGLYEGFSNVICIKSYQDGLIFASSGTGSYANAIRSMDYGITWEEVMIFPSNTEYIYDIEIENPNKIYLGTIDFIEGGGVYQSINGGDTWEHIGLTDHYVSSLALNSFGDLFAGTRGHNSLGIGGVYVLPYEQTEWQNLQNDDLVISMVINSEDEIYIGCSALIYLGGGVRCSVDNGLTWTDISIESMYIYDIEGLTLGDEQHLYVHEHNGSKLYKTVNSTITKINEDITEKNIGVFNYPNPFSSETLIYFSVPESDYESLKLSIFNCQGKLIQEHTTNFNINNSIKLNATGLQSGVYYCVLSVGDMMTYNKMVIQK